MSNTKRSSNDHHRQESKANKEEFETNLESDSGFLSGALQSEPLSEIIDSTEQSVVPKKPDIEKFEKNQEKQKTEVMDLDSGAIVSQDLTESMCKLKLHQSSQMKNSQNEAYFQVNEDGDTLLHLAIIWPHKQVTKTLIRLAPSSLYLDIQNDVYLTPLHLAVLTEQPEIVRDLVINGAKTTVRDRHGNTALHLACFNGHKECVKQLLLNSSDTMEKIPQNLALWNYDGETCIHLAAKCTKNSNIEIIKCLVEKGADINSREGKQGRTILHKAVEDCNEAFIVLLLSECPTIDVNATTYAGHTAYQLAEANATYNQKYKRILQELIRFGADDISMMYDDSESDDELMLHTQQNTKSFNESNSCPVNVN